MGNVNHKVSSDERVSKTQKLSKIFAKRKLSLFYQIKGSKDQTLIKFCCFSLIQELKDGISIENDYLSEKDFTINGNLSISTFMANEEFNNIIKNSLQEYHFNQFTTGTNDGFKYFGDNYSRFISKSLQEPSIHPDIINKLSKAGMLDILGRSTKINPIIENDNSLELKNAIASEINKQNSSFQAVILPNGEFIIGRSNFFDNKDIEFKFISDPFESQ